MYNVIIDRKQSTDILQLFLKQYTTVKLFICVQLSWRHILFLLWNLIEEKGGNFLLLRETYLI
jgi:hypothetical protein